MNALDMRIARFYRAAALAIAGCASATSDVVRVRFTDVFVAKDGRWQAVSARETLEQVSS